MAKYKIIPIFVPHRGCPHQCSFCNQRHITGQSDDMTPEKAKSIIEMYLGTIDTKKYRTEIAFYGGSFTAIDIEYQTELLKTAFWYVENRGVKGIRLSTRPDCISVEILENLSKYGVTEIELGVQSMCNNVLVANNRGHSADDVVNAVNLIRKYNFSLGLQQMTGLYKDSDEADLYTAKKLCELRPDFVRIYPTLVFNNTDLADYFKTGLYTPHTLEHAVVLCKKIKKIYDEYNVKIIRLGLLMSDDEAKNNYLSGPYHPRFRELVEK